MKKSILALAVLAVSSAAAFAQSSVTVFGILDVNARSVKNGSVSIKQLGNNGYSANQLGFRGVEDLGGGLRAGFHIESALSPDVGTATTENGSSKFWQRRSTVSLIGGFGEIRLGRDLDPSYLNMAQEAFGNLGLGSNLNFVTGLGSGTTTIVRADNMIAYHAPANLGGFFGSLGVAAGEGTPGVKYTGGRIGYAAGPIFVSAATGNTQTATKDDFKMSNLAATYDFGAAKVFTLYNIQKWGNLDQKLISVGAHVPVGDFLLRASVVKVDQSGRTAANVSTDANDSSLVALGGVYFLSKRTALYSTYSQITNKGSAAFSISGNAGVVPVAAALGKKSSGYEFGLRHGF
jgi:predicted porin